MEFLKYIVYQFLEILRRNPQVLYYSSVLWGDSFSTVEVVQYSGGIASVLWGNSFSTVEVVQYSGGITSVHTGG